MRNAPKDETLRFVFSGVMLAIVLPVTYVLLSRQAWVSFIVTVFLLAAVLTVLDNLSNIIRQPNTAADLLQLVLPSSKEREYIIGDLIEEYSQFPSRLQAHLWLYKQVLKSVLPLAYQTLKSRLASYLGERIR
jgi:hypothetical protein